MCETLRRFLSLFVSSNEVALTGSVPAGYSQQAYFNSKAAVPSMQPQTSPTDLVVLS